LTIAIAMLITTITIAILSNCIKFNFMVYTFNKFKSQGLKL